ncbi:MAG: hypothetical protein NTY77_07505 [Elusimicrobia bacterium]|nr:hypothetical protein [Elusimicrobiota bacterium]
MDRINMHLILPLVLSCGLTQICAAAPIRSEDRIVGEAATAIDDCYHWAGEVGDQSEERNKEISKGIARDCPNAEQKAQKAYKLYPKNALLASKILELMDIGHFKASDGEKTTICDVASSWFGTAFQQAKREDDLFRGACPDQARKLYGK